MSGRRAADVRTAATGCVTPTPWGPLAARFSEIGLVKAWFPALDTGRRSILPPARGVGTEPKTGAEPALDDERRLGASRSNPHDPRSSGPCLWSEAWAAAVGRFLLDGAVTLPLDLSPFRPWTRALYARVLAIPPGRTTTYGALARATGRPGAARAVGAALQRQPFAFFLPTHRVWPARGGPGRCSSGAGHLRLELLRREGLI